MSYRTVNTLGGISSIWSDTDKGYDYNSFKECEKCGNKDLQTEWLADIYACNVCGFDKPISHVSFGFYLKIPNYRSLTKTHAADKLFFSDGRTIEKCFLKSRAFRYKGVALGNKHDAAAHWTRWVRENKVEIIRLAAIADKYTLGADHRMEVLYNPMNYLTEPIKEQQGIFLSILNIKHNVGKKRSRQKIGNAINYILRRTRYTFWLGGTHPGHPASVILQSANNRLNNYHRSFFGYKNYDAYSSSNALQTHRITDYAPVYLTGPSISDCMKHGFSQENLDVYVDKFLTDWDNDLPENAKLRVILNTGNSGIDTSVTRWAIKNNRYLIVVNLHSPVYTYFNNEFCRDNTNADTMARLVGEI